MKRLTIIFSCLFISSLSYAANKMSMVTYFPVPYVAYSQVNVAQQLDVGLTTACTMNLGCSESDTNLKANTVNLKGGKLELNQGKGIAGTSITLGMGTGNGQISFKDVRIQSGNMQSLNADTMNVQTLNLFGKPFPPCRGKGGSGGQMKWGQLKLQGYSGTDSDGELYLVCGSVNETQPEPSECDSTEKLACLSGGSGDDYVAGVWDEESCLCECPSDSEMTDDGRCIKTISCVVNMGWTEEGFASGPAWPHPINSYWLAQNEIVYKNNFTTSYSEWSPCKSGSTLIPYDVYDTGAKTRCDHNTGICTCEQSGSDYCLYFLNSIIVRSGAGDQEYFQRGAVNGYCSPSTPKSMCGNYKEHIPSR